MSQSEQQSTPTVTKLAYVTSVIDTLNDLGCTKWASIDDAAAAAYGVAQKLAFDPATDVPTKEAHAQVVDVIEKLAECSMEEHEKQEKEKKKDKEKSESKSDEEKYKEARLAYVSQFEGAEQQKQAAEYFDLYAVASYKVASNAGLDPKKDNPGNSAADAAKHDPVGAIDQRHRPDGYAENPPNRKVDPAADAGKEQPHPKGSELGKTAAQAILDEILGKHAMAQHGLDPVIDNPGNSPEEAATHDPVGAIDQIHRPSGYAENPPDREVNPAAHVGTQGPHPNADNLGKTARFRETVEMAMGNSTFAKLAREHKIAHAEAMMNLTPSQKVAYLEKLSARAA